MNSCPDRKLLLVLAAAAVAVLAPCRGSAESLLPWEYLNVWGGIGTLGGDVTYRIGGRVVDASGVSNYPFPISELVWPVNVPAATAGATMGLDENWEVSACLSQSIASASGKMRDSDWFISGIPEPLLHDYASIYSESDNAVNGFRFDVGARCWLGEGERNYHANTVTRYGLGLGLLYEDFSWTASNVDQWYPLDPELGHDRAAGVAGTYAASMVVPYAELAGKTEGADYSLLVTAGFSPAVQAEDRDDHVLRMILAQGREHGYAFKAGIAGRYDFMPPFFVTAQGDFLSVTTEGTADTSVYGGPSQGDSWTIDHKVTSTQYTILLLVGMHF